MQRAHRTQLYIPEDLRTLMDRQRALSGESMAEYTRKAIKERVDKEKKRKVDLKKLADEVTSGVNKSGWECIDVIKWQREIRKDRKII